MFVWISSIWPGILDLPISDGITSILCSGKPSSSKTKLEVLALRSMLLCMICKSMMLHLVIHKNLAGKISPILNYDNPGRLEEETGVSRLLNEPLATTFQGRNELPIKQF